MLRYFGDYVVSTLADRRLKVAIPSKLNDPFDFSIAAVGTITEEDAMRILTSRLKDPAFYAIFRENSPTLTDDEIQRIVLENIESGVFGLVGDFQALKDHLKSETHKIADKNVRLLCFCDELIDSHGDILMWSHYGYCHQGFRLHFDDSFLLIPGIERREAQYHPDRVALSINLTTEDPEFKKRVFESTFRKGLMWSYERETRYLIPPRLCARDEILKMEFFTFPASSLRRIDIGIRSDPKTSSKVMDLLQTHEYSHVEIFKADVSDFEFSITYDKVR
jgi:hypothetical protein